MALLLRCENRASKVTCLDRTARYSMVTALLLIRVPASGSRNDAFGAFESFNHDLKKSSSVLH